MSQEEWISFKEISQELGIPERTLLYFKQQGDFPAVFRFGKKHRRVRVEDFSRWIAEHKELTKTKEIKNAKNE